MGGTSSLAMQAGRSIFCGCARAGVALISHPRAVWDVGLCQSKGLVERKLLIADFGNALSRHNAFPKSAMSDCSAHQTLTWPYADYMHRLFSKMHQFPRFKTDL